MKTNKFADDLDIVWEEKEEKNPNKIEIKIDKKA